MPDAYKKKLIEVALPLDAINAEAAREKSIRHGHPSTLHLWWARRPLAACRAVLFASMVDDPSAHPDKFPTEEAQAQERQRLFRLIEELVKWENINNEKVLERARREIRKYAPEGGPPPVLDPFAGGGSIPLEAQRLGLEAHAGDLNPVAVLINKAMIELPSKFADQPPVNPEAREDNGKIMDGRQWTGAKGLAEDVRYYGEWMRKKAKERIGHLYPPVTITQKMLDRRADLREQGYEPGDELTVIAWIWARTVPSPNPAAGGKHIPLVRSFWLSKGRKKYGQKTWVEPIVDQENLSYRFEVRMGDGKPQKGTIKRGGGRCLLTGAALNFPYVRDQGKKGNLGKRLMAIVAEGDRGRVYFDPVECHAKIAFHSNSKWKPNAKISHWPGRTNVVEYGMTGFADLFTDRQLLALTTFSDLVRDTRAEAQQNAATAGVEQPKAYADALATYLAFIVDRASDYWSTIATWVNSGEFIRNTFARQAIPMTWDFAEVNPFSDSTGNWLGHSVWVQKVIKRLPIGKSGKVKQVDAATSMNGRIRPVISTDPPYYDNIGYADLSDFFYVWLRRSLGKQYPKLLSTMLTPKADEMIATPYRHDGGKEEAKEFFEEGLRKSFDRMRSETHPAYPLTLFYAFKQEETTVEDGTSSTGWETMLKGLIEADFQITGTWPMRTERSGKITSKNNVLASSIVLACRPRPDDAPRVTRGQFLKALKDELPEALQDLQRGNIAPVDLAQASIGPGMAIYSRCSQVVEADGSPMTVRTALALINQVLDEYLTEQEGEYDADTRWALAWYEQHGFEPAPYGDAETLSTAKNTSVQGMADAGFLKTGKGKVRLFQRGELDGAWEPGLDKRITVWEATQHLIGTLDSEGEEGAARLLVALRADGRVLPETARDLAYRLYALCERKGRAAEALAYNRLIVAWPQIERLAGTLQQSSPTTEQGELEL